MSNYCQAEQYEPESGLTLALYFADLAAPLRVPGRPGWRYQAFRREVDDAGLSIDAIVQSSLGLTSEAFVCLYNAASFFTELARDTSLTRQQRATAARLRAAMYGHLADVTCLWAKVPGGEMLYVFGFAPDGTLAGLKACC